MPESKPILPEGPAAFLSSLPLRRLEAALKETRLPVQISNTAGLYVCNCVFYTAAALAAKRFPGMQAGFIHVPYLPEQTADEKTPSLCLKDDVHALETVCAQLVEISREILNK